MKIKNFRANGWIISYEVIFSYSYKHIYIQYLNITFNCLNKINIIKDIFEIINWYSLIEKRLDK